jgi:hypothetical protein
MIYAARKKHRLRSRFLWIIEAELCALVTSQKLN